MNTLPTRCYVVHDSAGHILAIAPITATQTSEGTSLGWRPVAAANQVVSEIELSDEHAKLPLHELLAFELKTDARSGAPSLRAKAKP